MRARGVELSGMRIAQVCQEIADILSHLDTATGNSMIQSLPSPGGPTTLARRRILVVDDNVDAAMLLAMLLREEGHEVATSHDGLSALETAVAFRPDIVLLDIGLPHMDGNEVAMQMRQQPALRDVLLVAVSGYGQEENRRRALKAGFNAYLVKPLTLEMLNEVLVQFEPATGA
jgi:CheY-like chemotaxis protein